MHYQYLKSLEHILQKLFCSGAILLILATIPKVIV
jgi:hypothetical protein